jgi:hypothetical protein
MPVPSTMCSVGGRQYCQLDEGGTITPTGPSAPRAASSTPGPVEVLLGVFSW